MMTEPEEHARLEALAVALLAWRVRDETLAAWDAFERALSAHLSAEETLVLPAFAFANPDEARRISAEHDGLRARLLELGAAIARDALCRADVNDLVAQLRAHARREGDLMDRWARKNLEAAMRDAVAVR